MKKITQFLSWFPKLFNGKNHEQILEEISSSLAKTLTESTLEGEKLKAEDLGIIVSQFKTKVKGILTERKLNLENELKKTTETINRL